MGQFGPTFVANRGIRRVTDSGVYAFGVLSSSMLSLLAVHAGGVWVRRTVGEHSSTLAALVLSDGAVRSRLCTSLGRSVYLPRSTTANPIRLAPKGPTGRTRLGPRHRPTHVDCQDHTPTGAGRDPGGDRTRRPNPRTPLRSRSHSRGAGRPASAPLRQAHRPGDRAYTQEAHRTPSSEARVGARSTDGGRTRGRSGGTALALSEIGGRAHHEASNHAQSRLTGDRHQAASASLNLPSLEDRSFIVWSCPVFVDGFRFEGSVGVWGVPFVVGG